MHMHWIAVCGKRCLFKFDSFGQVQAGEGKLEGSFYLDLKQICAGKYLMKPIETIILWEVLEDKGQQKFTFGLALSRLKIVGFKSKINLSGYP